MPNITRQRSQELLVAHTLNIAEHAVNLMLAAHYPKCKPFSFGLSARGISAEYSNIVRDAKKWRELNFNNRKGNGNADLPPEPSHD